MSAGPGGGAAPRPRLVHRLPFPVFLALRYLRSTRRDAFVSFLSAVAAGGIGLGVAALVLALGALSGLQRALRTEVLGRTPHLEIELPAGTDRSAVTRRLGELPSVVGVQEMARGRGWLRSGRLVQAVELVGYSGTLPRFFPGAAGSPPGLYVSRDLAHRWLVEPGQPVEVVSPRPTLGPLGPQPRVRSMEVAGTFDTGRTEEIERVALPLPVLLPLVGDEAVRLEVTAGGLEEALALAPRVRALLPAGATVRTWEELNRPLFFALKLEKGVMFVAVSLIVVVAALALVADLARVITSKRAELGMLGTLGATPRRLQLAVLLLGAFLAAAGMGTGVVVGSVLAVVLDRYRLVHLPGQVYFLDYLPFRVEVADVAAVLAVTLLLALASSLFVAGRVSRLRPVDAMRR